MTQDQVRKIIMDSSNKSCSLDPCPTWLVKGCLEALLPIITEVVNLSLLTPTVPENLKEAIIMPLIKKLILDPEIFKNFRPISNLKYISKIVEKVVAFHVHTHMSLQDLYELFQSAYKCFHSTETALLRVHNDCMRAMDDGQSVILVLLDLSAAFDTVDHKILLDTLSSNLGITGKALAWFQSYLSGRSESVGIDGVFSKKHTLTCGVPQGSVLGPLLFTIYTLPLAEICRKYNLCYYFFADDSQLYIAFRPLISGAMCLAAGNMEMCIAEIRACMLVRLLKLNDDKTEMLLLHSRYQKNPEFPSIKIGDAIIHCNDSARNIGVIFDSHMSMEKQVSSITKQAFFHLRNISKIRAYLSSEALETVCHAFITSRLDNGNAILYGISKKLLSRLQYVQNSTARMITSTRKFEHITPILHDLHWLPIAQRIQFKLLLMTYKCLHGIAPQYLCELLEPCRNAGLRSTTKRLLQVPQSKLKTYGDKAFSVAAPSLWNTLPQDIRDSPSVDVFKKRLKTYLFNQAF